MLAWESIAQFFHTKIKEKQTYLFENAQVMATPSRYLKADMIPFDITLNSGATVSPKKASIKIPEPNFSKIDVLQSMINRRTNIRALIIDYDESASDVTLHNESVATKRELTVADDTGFKIQATLWGETATTFEPELGKAVMIARGGHSLIWPIRGRAAGQGMVFGLLCPEQGIQFYANLS